MIGVRRMSHARDRWLRLDVSPSVRSIDSEGGRRSSRRAGCRGRRRNYTPLSSSDCGNALSRFVPSESLDRLVAAVASRSLDPYSAADEILK
jgi:hypothetical protein